MNDEEVNGLHATPLSRQLELIEGIIPNTRMASIRNAPISQEVAVGKAATAGRFSVLIVGPEAAQVSILSNGVVSERVRYFVPI